MTDPNLNSTCPKREKLITPNYIYAFLSSFLMFFAFYLILPVLPMYLRNEFSASKSLIGIILASYTITALLIRPFAGFLVDYFARKPLLVVCYFLFIAFFAGYILAGTVMLFAIIRATHGLAFGLVTISNSTMAVDVMPTSRRNEGIGYYALSVNLSMAIGPMIALYLYDRFGNFDYVFMTSFIAGLVGLVCVLMIKAPKRERVVHEAISFDRFFLYRGLPGAITLSLLAFSYGLLTTYVAIYGVNEVGIESGIGLFFVAMAAGLVLARVVSAKLMNRGELNKIITVGIITMALSYAVFIFMQTPLFFFISAVALGLSYGFVCPAFQAMFINLSHHNQRGTANSTYYISWDLGIGVGVLIGGQIADMSNYAMAYIVGMILVVIGLLVFKSVAAGYYLKHRLTK